MCVLFDLFSFCFWRVFWVVVFCVCGVFVVVFLGGDFVFVVLFWDIFYLCFLVWMFWVFGVVFWGGVWLNPL